MRNNTHCTWTKASLQCYCMSSPHNCSEMHRNVAIPDHIAHSSRKHQDGHLSNRIRYLRVTVEYILIIEIDLLYGWAVWERRPNHVNKRVVADIWLLTVSWTLTWEMIRIRNFYCFVCRQHTWLRKWEVIVGGTWLIMLGFMDLGWPRVCRRSTSVLSSYLFWLCVSSPAVTGLWIVE